MFNRVLQVFRFVKTLLLSFFFQLVDLHLHLKFLFVGRSKGFPGLLDELSKAVFFTLLLLLTGCLLLLRLLADWPWVASVSCSGSFVF